MTRESNGCLNRLNKDLHMLNTILDCCMNTKNMIYERLKNGIGKRHVASIHDADDVSGDELSPGRNPFFLSFL